MTDHETLTRERADELPDGIVQVAIIEDEWSAVMSPVITESDVDGRDGAPFNFVVHGDAPDESEIADRLNEKFTETVDTVYDELMDADDLIEALKD